jgi:hypothetical protein
LSDNEQTRLDTRPYTTGYFEDLISQVKQWAHWIEVRDFLSSQPKTGPVTAIYTPVQGQQPAMDFKASTLETQSRQFNNSQEDTRFICIEPIPGTWAGDQPVKPLSGCKLCLTRYPWESYAEARYHLRIEHFAVDAKPGPLSFWVQAVNMGNDDGKVASSIPHLSTRPVGTSS